MALREEEEVLRAFKLAVEQGDSVRVEQLLDEHQEFADDIVDARCFHLGAPAIVVAANAENYDLILALLDHGADIHARSTYWGRTIGVLDESPEEMRRFLLQRGALPEISQFVNAVQEGRASEVKELLQARPELVELVDEPFFSFGAPAIVVANNNLEMLQVLLAFGADIEACNLHGFGVLDGTKPEIAKWLIERGAEVTIHAAVELGMVDRVHALVADDSARVHARGGDGQTPLHVAKGPELIEFLLDHGADIEARCSDHHSTPLQYQINEAAARECLVERGAHVDIFAAASMGDMQRIQDELDRFPACVHARSHQEGYDAVKPGSIYNWRLGFKLSPHQVAKQHEHVEAFEYLMAASPVEEQLINACLCGLDELARKLVADHPHLVTGLTERDATRFADAVWCGNLAAARLMLELGFDVETPYEEGPALTGACLFGNLEMVNLLLDHDASLRWRNQFGANPLGVTVWASKNFHCRGADYAGCARRFIDAGLDIEPWMRTGGSDEMCTVVCE